MTKLDKRTVNELGGEEIISKKSVRYAAEIGVYAIIMTGCSKSEESYGETYTVSRSGVFYRNEQFDVISVYGFSNNQSVAQQIADFLNQSEPDTYIIRLDE